MKLAFCLFKYFPYGGLQRDFLRIARECHVRGHEIHVYTMQWDAPLPPDLNVHLIKAKGWQNHTRSQSFVHQVKLALDKEKFDRVIGFNKMPFLDVYYAADVCYQARAREKHGWFYRLLPRYRHLVKFERAVFQEGNNTNLLLIAANQQAEFEKFYQTEANRFFILPPGISRDRQAPSNACDIRAKLRAEFNITHGHFILMVGSGFKTKGLDRAILALAALPEKELAKACLFVIGQDNANAFISLADRLGIKEKVIFLGGRPDVAKFLLAADLLIHPAYHENTGTVLLEALVAGLPVLTTDVCGYAHYIKQANAGKVLSSPYEQNKLNAVLLDMLTSPLKSTWKANAISFSHSADIYSMPEKAADCILEHCSKSSLAFEEYMSLKGECYRNQKGRITQRLILDNEAYFIKQHHGVGWREIFKNLIQLKTPVLGAKNEWQAIQKLNALKIDVPEVIAYAQKGRNPAKKKSFLMMKEIAPAISLEDLTKDWQKTTPAFSYKLALIRKVAKIARVLHQNGINHRDFYICHFLLNPNINVSTEQDFPLHLIDLHRAQVRRITPLRWVIKDLAALYFSSMNIGLTQRDLFRFMQEYQQCSLRQTIKNREFFWNKVKSRGDKLYREHSA